MRMEMELLKVQSEKMILQSLRLLPMPREMESWMARREKMTRLLKN
jgi:hypothetical protein